MSNRLEVRVPDIGDFSDVEVIEVLVEVGQKVAVEDGLITLETDKAAMDVPSPHAGTVASIAVAVGDKVSEGDIVLALDTDEAAAPADAGNDAAQSDASEPAEAGSSSDDDTVAMRPVTSVVELKVPNIGDFDDVEVIDVMIKPGDTIELEASLITLETDKATMDVPAEVAGTIKEVSVKVGDRVSAGTVVALCESMGAPSKAAPAASSTAAADAPSDAPQAQAPTPSSVPAEPAPATGAAPAALPPISETTFRQAHASPAVRKFARELGVDLGRVKGSGVKSRITKDDVKAFVKSVLMGGGEGAGAALPQLPKVDHAKFGKVSLEPLTRIQKISGPRLHASWVNIPHVTQNDLGDFTDTEEKRKEMKAAALEQGIKLTPLAFVVRACVVALQEFPLFNASLSDDGEAMVMKDYINIGFAADTPNGLMVPVIHNTEKLSLLDIAQALADLSSRAREGKLKATEMQGGTFTVSSLGGIGGTSFTPIINPPEVAILGVSRSSMQPVYSSGVFVPRLMLPLSLSYDHRVIDGASAARFTARLAQLVGDVDVLVDA